MMTLQEVMKAVNYLRVEKKDDCCWWEVQTIFHQLKAFVSFLKETDTPYTIKNQKPGTWSRQYPDTGCIHIQLMSDVDIDVFCLYTEGDSIDELL